MERKEGKISQSMHEIKEYIQMQSDMFRLNILEKSSKILSLLILIFVFLLLSGMTIFFFSIGLMYRLADLWNSQILAALGIGGLYITLIILVFVFKNALFVNPIVKQLSQILFDDKDDDEKNAINEEN